MHDASIPFHLLRPLWLIAIVPVAVIFAMLLWRQNPRAQWGRVIAPHLLQHLIVQPGKGRGINPLYLVAVAMVLGIIALSGPTWRREVPPFVENKAPLMIVLALSSTMDQTRHRANPSGTGQAEDRGFARLRAPGREVG